MGGGGGRGGGGQRMHFNFNMGGGGQGGGFGGGGAPPPPKDPFEEDPNVVRLSKDNFPYASSGTAQQYVWVSKEQMILFI